MKDSVLADAQLMKYVDCLLLVVLSLLGLTSFGCGKSGPAMYQVRGKVNFKGATPNAGIKLVSFVPARDGQGEFRRNATGPIEPDGSFVMSTRISGDGVNAGDYSVVFNVAKGPMDPTSLIPSKYSDIGSPPYKVTVDKNLDALEYTIEMSGAPEK